MPKPQASLRKKAPQAENLRRRSWQTISGHLSSNSPACSRLLGGLALFRLQLLLEHLDRLFQLRVTALEEIGRRVRERVFESSV
jgi:hypothetical protein